MSETIKNSGFVYTVNYNIRFVTALREYGSCILDRLSEHFYAWTNVHDEIQLQP